ncbi:MAG: hypothetical protein MUE88_08095, partial [Flavobacteriales bacterium]|nr:hypothetical protein [Flavobacteriales bacterium]
MSICTPWLHPVVRVDHAQCIADDGERLQPQEVHLDHARILDHLAVELGDEHRRVLAGAHRDMLGEVAGCDDQAGSMDAHSAHTAFQLLGFAQHVGGELAALQDLPQLFSRRHFLRAEVLFGLQAAFSFQRSTQHAVQFDPWPLWNEL